MRVSKPQFLPFFGMAVLAGSIAAGCAGREAPPPRTIDAPREITQADATDCRDLGLVMKQSVRGSQKTFGSERAMQSALDTVLDAGGNAYRLLDVSDDSPGGGAQVILQAYRCD